MTKKYAILLASWHFFSLAGVKLPGLPDLHAADIIRDVALLSEARDEAASFVDGPAAEEQVLSALKRRFGGSFQKLLNN